eukprot:NODE_898_length_1250_cov_224.090758_g684_i0.p1 GENE.NODE_898_length_1250_cov_224.090758_g684_i0~~NODE_898_length_1250_cov_224.090758_g684_i0.p1  ORF type:complete len:340 (+),score=111.90 NODE_898_length_1250_cov_224.090758_g684_i0:78-1022(+)
MSDFVAPFLRTAEFWVAEKDAPLLNMNLGFMEAQADLVEERTAKWADLLGLTEEDRIPIRDLETDALGVEIERIIEKDVERTFATSAMRSGLQRVLRGLASEFGNYAQAMSYVCGFLMLTHDAPTAAAMLRVLNNNSKYIPGYWTSEAIAFATDAYVFLPWLQQYEPEVAASLQTKCILPETYLQKWWVALCIQSLPFESGVIFFEEFLKGGYIYLFQFALAMHNHFRDELLAAKDHAAVYTILRLDASALAKKPITQETFAKALTYEFPGLDITAAREEAYNTHLKARIERAKQLAEMDDDLSDFDTEEEDDE